MNASIVGSKNHGVTAVRGWASAWLVLAWLVAAGGVSPCVAQTFEVVHTFVLGDGYWPMGPVTFDRSGNLYGTTFGGGRGAGSLYEINRKGEEKVLHFFRNSEGIFLEGAPVVDSAGNVYGTASQGARFDYGSVFEYTSSGTLEIVLQFGGSALNGASPRAGLVRDGAGNLYGTTYSGGTGGTGVVFKIDHSTGIYTVRYNFNETEGCCSIGQVLIGLDGNLYGTLSGYGAFGFGSIFKVDPNTGTGTILHAFTNGSDGGLPAGTLAQDAAGNLYGTTYQGGSVNYGTLYKFDLTTNTFTTLWNFFQDGTYGANPYAGPVIDQAGNLYGTTYNGNTVYELTASGQFITLHLFSGGSDGSFPWAGVILHGGSLYGTTQFGGDPLCNCGVVFKITP